jgi:hypothetical protein
MVSISTFHNSIVMPMRVTKFSTPHVPITPPGWIDAADEFPEF